MLVFTRKVGESLIIGDNIEVTVLSVERDHVRVGVSAPREIPIHRQEVYQAIMEQNQMASRSPAPTSDLLARFKHSPKSKGPLSQ